MAVLFIPYQANFGLQLAFGLAYCETVLLLSLFLSLFLSETRKAFKICLMSIFMIFAVFDPTARDDSDDINIPLLAYLGFSIVFPNLSPTLAMYHGLDPNKYGAKGFTRMAHENIAWIGASIGFNYIAMLAVIIIVISVEKCKKSMI